VRLPARFGLAQRVQLAVHHHLGHLHDRRVDPGGRAELRGIQVSARAGTILGSFEILVFLVLAVWLIAKAGSHNTGNVFTLHYATIKGYKGFSGIAVGSIYTILAFIGFEASAPLAEEARNPRRTIQVAVVASCLVIGLFYVLTTYAGDVFFGPDKFVTFGGLGGGSPWIQLARDAWGLGWVGGSWPS
jgi:amino acid transporter